MTMTRTAMLVEVAVLAITLGCSKDAERGSRNTPSESASPVGPSSVGAIASSTGGRLRFRSPGITKAVEFPPRNEPFAFRSNDLEATYRDGLHRSPNASAVDIEGTIVWTQEYLRYRVNLCDHEEAIQKVFAQIDGGGVQPTCGNAPSGQVAFPPRDQPFDFRTRLEAKYRDELRRMPSTTYVDVEGDIVWTQEYLRYRVSTCSHADAVQKVMAQIDGGGVQPDCTPPPPPPRASQLTANFVMRQNGRRTNSCDIAGDDATCTFDGTSSTPAQVITSYNWVLRYFKPDDDPNGGFLSTVNLTGAIAQHFFVCIGTVNTSQPLEVTLTVRTASGHTATKKRDFTIYRATCGS